MPTRKFCMRKPLTMFLAALLLFFAAGCEADATAPPETAAPVTETPSPYEPQETIVVTEPPRPTPVPNGINVTVLGKASMEAELNLVKSQLEKTGFVVTLDVQAEDEGYKNSLEAGGYDLALRELDEYEYRKAETGDGESSRLPLFITRQSLAYNTAILNPESLFSPSPGVLCWEALDFSNEALRGGEPLVIYSPDGELGSLDPLFGGGGADMINANMYIRLVNISGEGAVTADGSLSYSFAVCEGSIYFVLRDNVNFTQVSKKHAVDTKIRVGAEDVAYSLTRAGFTAMPEEISIIGDLSELDGITTNTGISLIEALEAGTPGKIAALTINKDEANNSRGVYQIVKLPLNGQAAQVLRRLAQAQAGIVCTGYAESAEDYGSVASVTEGQTYKNNLITSGPYIAVYMSSTGLVLEKNPAYMHGTEYEPKIKTILVKFDDDYASVANALQDGKAHILPAVPDEAVYLFNNSEIALLEINGGTITYLDCASADENLRRALSYSVASGEFAGLGGSRSPADLVPGGFGVQASPEKVSEYLAKYWAAR